MKRQDSAHSSPRADAVRDGTGICRIAGIGASAGGLEAFMRLLRALPARIGMALLLVQHLDPKQTSMLADILGHHSKMPVADAENGTLIEPDHVYVMPAGVTMTVSRGAIHLSERPKHPMQVLPIDTLLRSLADEYGSLSIGVVLSGTGTDGALGMTAVKAACGLTFAQEPSSAEYDGMPKASIDAGVVDVVLDPEHIAKELVRIGKHPGVTASEARDEAPEVLDEESFTKILSLVRDSTGLDLSSYRKTTLMRRISRRMLLQGIADMKAYVSALQERPSEVEALYRDVLVNMTEFFRDPEALDALRSEVFPRILEHKDSGASIRIWVPGCSKGQEAYSILITLVELLDETSSHLQIQMFATDVNERDVDFARSGVYPQSIAEEVSPERLARFFVQVPGGYQIDRSIREMCVFAVHDVTKDPPFSKLDLVTFRNVLIYMERPLQQRVLQILHYALAPGGFLLLGSSETTGPESKLFSIVDKKHRIYERKPGPGKLLSALAPSSGVLGFAKRVSTPEQVPAFDVLAEADSVVRGGYQPAGVLVTADLDVLQFRGHVGSYLDPPEGTPEFKLPRLIGPGLFSIVDASMREAAKTRAAAKRRGKAPDCDGKGREVDVESVPIVSPTGEFYYLVLFTERPTESPSPQTRTEQPDARVTEEAETAELRRQLDEMREQLGVVVAERESANANLRAESERSQSSNEELRTINEEFQTAQEELQSTNEELTTLNDELRNRNSELGLLADDLTNVIEGVEIPILILDSDLRIRRFTPQTDRIVNIMPSDVGRPITDFRLKVDVADFKDRVYEVLQSGAPSQTEASDSEGHWFYIRVRPYLTSKGTVDGVVVAFVDINELKEKTEIAEAAREHAEAVVTTVREPLLILGGDLEVREANDAFYRTFEVTHEETIGTQLYELGDGQWDFPELRSVLEQVLPGNLEFADFEVERDFPRIGHRVMVLGARRVREEGGRPSILLAINDLTQARRRSRLSASLNNISAMVSSTLELDKIMEQVLKESSQALGAVSAAVLLNQDSMQVVTSVYGLPRELLGRVFEYQELPPEIASQEARVPAILSRDEAGRFMSSLGVEADNHPVLAIPMSAREEKIGSVIFHYDSSGMTTGEPETDFAMRLGTLLSFTFENAKLLATQREIAETLQSALLTVPPRVPGLDFGYLYRSATAAAAVGGDFYDLFELDGRRVGILLGDVSGKGVQAATLTALVKNTVRALAYENESPATVVGKTSAAILKVMPVSIFVTLVFCVLDTESGRLVYCSAGHTRGIVKRQGGDIDLLDVGSPLAGAFEDVEFNNGEMQLDIGDMLLLYTDGVTEARRDKEMFGEVRLVEFTRALGPLPPRKLTEAVFEEVVRYTDGKLSDDVAIVAMERTPGHEDPSCDTA